EEHTLTGRGHFVAKYDLDGECEWVQGVSFGRTNDIALDAQGTIFALGVHPSLNSFLVKYDASGNEIWTKYIADGFSGQVTLDHDTLVIAANVEADSEFLGTPFTVNTSAGEGVVLRLDTAAETVYSMQQYGSDSLVRISDLAVVPDGSLLIAGSFFQSLFLPADTFYSPHNGDVRFLMRTTSDGTPIWVRTWDLLEYLEPLSVPRMALAADSTVHLIFSF